MKVLKASNFAVLSRDITIGKTFRTEVFPKFLYGYEGGHGLGIRPNWDHTLFFVLPCEKIVVTSLISMHEQTL